MNRKHKYNEYAFNFGFAHNAFFKTNAADPQ